MQSFDSWLMNHLNRVGVNGGHSVSTSNPFVGAETICAAEAADLVMWMAAGVTASDRLEIQARMARANTADKAARLLGQLLDEANFSA